MFFDSISQQLLKIILKNIFFALYNTRDENLYKENDNKRGIQLWKISPQFSIHPSSFFHDTESYG